MGVCLLGELSEDKHIYTSSLLPATGDFLATSVNYTLQRGDGKTDLPKAVVPPHYSKHSTQQPHHVCGGARALSTEAETHSADIRGQPP